MRNNQPVTDREYEILDDQNLISRTDIKGRITYASPTFVEVSGFEHDELLGAPHNLIRHPDMPPEAFANLWDTIKVGDVWIGLVKNRRKNGDYYWVQAHVVPIIEAGKIQGFTSVRVKPTEKDRQQAEMAYSRLRQGKARHIGLQRGRIVRRGLMGWLMRLQPFSIRGSMVLIAVLAVMLAASGDWIGWQGQVVGSLLVLMLGGISYRRIETSVDRTRRFAMQIAAGNLLAAPPGGERNEMGDIIHVMSVMRRSLANISIDINKTLTLVDQETRELRRGHDALASRTHQQAASLQQTAASMEELTITVQQNSSNTGMATGHAQSARREVSRSNDDVQKLAANMAQISTSAGKVTEAIEVIESIAFQTNLLALNASVEAARAGAHGRGFAVVAQEVRQLAVHSSSSADKIRELIKGSLQTITAGERQMQQLQDNNQSVDSAVTTIDDLIQEIAIASREQAQGLQQINEAVAEMDQVTQHNATQMQHSAELGSMLTFQVGELKNAISSLRMASDNSEHVRETERIPPDLTPWVSDKREAGARQEVGVGMSSPQAVVP